MPPGILDHQLSTAPRYPVTRCGGAVGTRPDQSETGVGGRVLTWRNAWRAQGPALDRHLAGIRHVETSCLHVTELCRSLHCIGAADGPGTATSAERWGRRNTRVRDRGPRHEEIENPCRGLANRPRRDLPQRHAATRGWQAGDLAVVTRRSGWGGRRARVPAAPTGFPHPVVVLVATSTPRCC